MKSYYAVTSCKSFVFIGSKKLVCSVSLPAPIPLAEHGSSCVQRCFIVCVQKVTSVALKRKPLFSIVISQALTSNILSNVFSRFGSLIEVYMLPNKNCGYAKYANANSAQKAIQTLNGAEVCGVKLKVSNKPSGFKIIPTFYTYNFKVMEAEEQQQVFKRRHSDDE